MEFFRRPGASLLSAFPFIQNLRICARVSEKSKLKMKNRPSDIWMWKKLIKLCSENQKTLFSLSYMALYTCKSRSSNSNPSKVPLSKNCGLAPCSNYSLPSLFTLHRDLSFCYFFISTFYFFCENNFARLGGRLEAICRAWNVPTYSQAILWYELPPRKALLHFPFFAEFSNSRRRQRRQIWNFTKFKRQQTRHDQMSPTRYPPPHFFYIWLCTLLVALSTPKSKHKRHPSL